MQWCPENAAHRSCHWNRGYNLVKEKRIFQMKELKQDKDRKVFLLRLDFKDTPLGTMGRLWKMYIWRVRGNAEDKAEHCCWKQSRINQWKPSHGTGDLTWRVLESLKGIVKRRATFSYYPGTKISLTFYFYQMSKLEKTVLALSEEFLLSSSKIPFTL